MVIKISRSSSIFGILAILLFMPGYFGLYRPFMEGSYQNVSIWVNILLSFLALSVVRLAIRSLSYSFEINESGITQKTIGSWTLKWQDISGWGYSASVDRNYLFFELTPGNNRREVLSGFLDDRNLAVITPELEKRIGKPLKT